LYTLFANTTIKTSESGCGRKVDRKLLTHIDNKSVVCATLYGLEHIYRPLSSIKIKFLTNINNAKADIHS